MQISYKQIVQFLKDRKINFSLRGAVYRNYKICSLFYPEANGFYFFSGDDFKTKLEQSLILTSSQVEIERNNGVICVEGDPQTIFYMILDHYFREESTGKISKTASIHKDAVIGINVQIDSFAVLGDCVIGDNTIIKSHVVVEDNSYIGRSVIVEPHCTIGATGTAWVWGENGTKVRQPQLGGVVIKDRCFLGANSSIVKGSLNENTKIGENTVIAPGAKIGHGTQIGNYVHFANNVVTGGNSKIADFCFVGSSVTFRPKVAIHPYTVIGAGAVVVENTSKENLLLVGVPAKERPASDNLTGVPNFK
ncbi:hypothetical protein ACNKXS_00245 [Christiangramia marina]|uniref:hypothetical protein n=1 Tax=Christiangramia marina TaxID=409436 RepID=UPI003AA80626